MSVLAPFGSIPAPHAKSARRDHARSGAGPRLFVAGEAAPTSTYIEPLETPITIDGRAGRIASWTAEEWDALGAMQPNGALRLAAGVRILYFAN